LVARALHDIARDQQRTDPDGPCAARIETWLGALAPRVMFPGGWTAAARQAGAEPLWTGRGQPDDESTLRQAAGRLAAAGCTAHVAAAVWPQVTAAVAAADEPVIAYTDMFDQPYYTKKVARAAPIGRLGNRILAATYFGLTTIALPQGPPLCAHLSWHKPAAPLRDGLEDLFAADARQAWWHDPVGLHIVDRGANGDPVLTWLWGWEVPYLTIGHKRADRWRFQAPTLTDAAGRPLVVRPDRRLAGTAADGPWEYIVPAAPDDPASTRGIRFRAAVLLTEADGRALHDVYTSRWPSIENQLKALQARGFGRNRTRRLELTTSRGTDGALARLREREAKRLTEIRDLDVQSPAGERFDKIVKTAAKVTKVRATQAATAAAAPRKFARPVGGAEWLAKGRHLLLHNALALALYTSVDEAVRVMTPALVFELLLGRAALACLEAGRLTLWVDPVTSADDRRQQSALVEVFNKLALRCRGATIVIRLHERPMDRAP
jgi:hypothetical protein